MRPYPLSAEPGDGVEVVAVPVFEALDEFADEEEFVVEFVASGLLPGTRFAWMTLSADIWEPTSLFESDDSAVQFSTHSSPEVAQPILAAALAEFASSGRTTEDVKGATWAV